MRYFITLSYDGTRYHGWQVQPNGISVQGELQRALSLLLRQEIQVTGAGRTDTGVHARKMVAHFEVPAPTGVSCPSDPRNSPNGSDCQSEPFGLPVRAVRTGMEPRPDIPSSPSPVGDAPDTCPNPVPLLANLTQLAYKLNRLLPCDIAIQKIEPVADDLHARFSATSRTYRYYVHTGKQPFLRHYSLQLHYDLDFGLMNEAAALLLGYDDFGAFCKSHADVKTTLCHVTHAQWHQTSDTEWYFEITANRFLRNMVRAVVGTLVDVGRRRLTLDDFRKVIEGKKRTEAGESMPANALFLEEIKYEATDLRGGKGEN